MKLTIAELRKFIRNAMSPGMADREQLKPAGKRGWDRGVLDQEHEEEVNADLTIDRGPQDLGLTIHDPYVNQDRPAPTAGGRKFGRNGS